MASLEERWLGIKAEIESACRESGRDVRDVSTIVVTKFHPVSLIRDLHSLGVRHIGESRHQEAVKKKEELVDLEMKWHFVGQLQSNKARAVAAYCDVVHSVDRQSLVDSLTKHEAELDVFIEVNTSSDPKRGGVDPSQVKRLAERILATGNLKLQGLMAVAPRELEPAKAFDEVIRIQSDLHQIAPEARHLSMGMSGDFREAVVRGATHLRIGTAITGKRPTSA